MGIRTYSLEHPENLDSLKAEVIKAQEHDSPLEVHGRETSNELQRRLGENALRHFSLLLWQVQLGDDYGVQAQDEDTGDWATIGVEETTDKLTLVAINDE